MLNGRHHGILIDKRNRKTILFNDRYGLHRTYYFEGENAFYFSTEAKAILKVCPQLRQIDMVSLAELFIYNCVLENRSLFRNIDLLPCASFWTFHGNERVNKKECYFIPSALERQTLLEKEFHYERLRYVFQKVIERYFRAEDKAGVFITRDLDNRIILANAKFGQGKLPCYTLSAMSGYNNATEDRKIAEAVGQMLHIVTLDAEFLNQYCDLAEKAVYISDGNMGISGAAELYLYKKAREIAPLQLSGNYGGAILRKNKLIHLNDFNRSIFNNEFQATLNQAFETYREFPSTSLTHNLNIGIPWAEYAKLSIGQSQLIIRIPFLDNDFVELMYRAPDEIMDSDEVSLRLIKDGNPRLAKIAIGSSINLSIVDTYRKVLGGILNKLNKSVLVRIVGPYTQLHGDVAFRNELSHYAKEILLERRAMNRPYINKPFLEHIIVAHTEGNKNYTNEINLLLTAELVHRLFID